MIFLRRLVLWFKDPDTQEMIKRLKALEDENAKLKKKAYNTSDPLTITESEYHAYVRGTVQTVFAWSKKIGYCKRRVVAG